MSKPLRYVLFWLPMPVLGVVNGALRELFLKNYIEENLANRLSVFSLITLLFMYGLAIKNQLSLFSRTDALVCCIIWIALTICFEFGFGHFVSGISYEKLLADYNMMEGKLWPLVLFFTGLLPFILRKMNSTA